MVFNLASNFLQYPEEEWKEYMEYFHDEVKQIEDVQTRTHFVKFLYFIDETPYSEICDQYVSTFDFNDRTTLYLTYSVFKDNRDRGPVLVKLREEFLAAGAELESDELPDYLPLILEFASISLEKSSKVLFLHLRSMERLCLELEAINSPYQHLLAACIQTIKRMKKTDLSSLNDERRII